MWTFANFISIVSFSLFVGSTVALNCYQCSGSDPTNPFQCNEWLTSDIDIKPEPCDNVYGAKYCIKHVGRFEDMNSAKVQDQTSFEKSGIGAKRFCSSLDLGNYCNYVQQPGDILNYRTCVYTCTGEGCNPATYVKPNRLLIVSLGLLILKVIITFYT